MPTIAVSLKDLSALAGEPISAETIEGLLPLVKGELKGVDGDEVRIELNDTNRPDLWSPEGIARQWRARRRGPQRYPFFDRAMPAAAAIQADPALARIRPWVGGFIARGPAVTEGFLRSLIQTQEKLSDHYGAFRKTLSMGVYRAAEIVFPVRYRAVGRNDRTFIPLGAETEMSLGEILEKHPKGIQYGRGVLPAEGPVPILEDARGRPLSFPPIINSRATGEVRPGDTDLFVEMTGSGENGFWQVTLGLNICAANLADRGYAIEPVNTLYAEECAPPLGRVVPSPHPLDDCGVREADLPVSLVRELLGTSLSAGQIVEALACYGVTASAPPPAVGQRARPETVSCRVPPWRMDLMHPVDLVEDVLLARGLASLPARMPEEFTVGRPDGLVAFVDAVRQVWIGLGFEEVFSNVLSAREDLRDRMNGRTGGIARILNPYSASYTVLRDAVLPSLLRVEAASAKALYPHRIFEAGEVETAREGVFRTEMRLAALVAHEKANFSELQSSLWAFLAPWGRKVRIQRPEKGKADPAFASGRHGAILLDETPIGTIGEIAAAVRVAWGIRVPAAALEIDLAALKDALFPSQ